MIIFDLGVKIVLINWFNIKCSQKSLLGYKINWVYVYPSEQIAWNFVPVKPKQKQNKGNKWPSILYNNYNWDEN